MPRAHRFTDPTTLDHLGRVQADTLVPCQQPTRRSLMISSDCYQQRCLKCPEVCIFHSRAEYLYGLLLEADPKVTAFTPQPFAIKVNGVRYTPDFYVLRNGQEYVLELKPRAEMDPALHKVVAAFFSFHGMTFEVIDNQESLSREEEALRWLAVIQVLVVADVQNLDTQALEWQLWQRCLAYTEEPVLGDLLPPDYQTSLSLEQVALFRLIHRHRLHIDLTRAPLDYDTVLVRCE